MSAAGITTISVDSKEAVERTEAREAGSDERHPEVAPFANHTIEGAIKKTHPCENSNKAFNVADVQFHVLLLKT